MMGKAYGAQSARAGGMFDATPPLLDVAVANSEYVVRDGRPVEIMARDTNGNTTYRVSIVSEEPYASEIAEQIATAECWEDLPTVEFEGYQIAGDGR